MSVIGYTTEIKAIKTSGYRKRDRNRDRVTHLFLSLREMCRAEDEKRKRERERASLKTLSGSSESEVCGYTCRTIRTPSRQTGNERRNLLTYRDLECFVRAYSSPPDRRLTLSVPDTTPFIWGSQSPVRRLHAPSYSTSLNVERRRGRASS